MTDKCPACEREMSSILPVPSGMTTVCCACLAVLVMDGRLRIATEQESAGAAPRRQLATARLIRRLFPPKDIR